MLRWVPILGLLLGLVGCGEARRTRAVPVTPAPAAAVDGAAAHPVTKAPRAIATH